MRLKPNTYPKLVFFYEKPNVNDPDNPIEIQVPAPGAAEIHSIEKLQAAVTASMTQNRVAIPPKLRLHIEHQICVRYGDRWRKYCFTGGIGDDIHVTVMRVTEKLGKMASKAGLKKLGKKVQQIGKCQGCGGTRTYRQGKNNLGRAGTLNSLTSQMKKNKLQS